MYRLLLPCRQCPVNVYDQVQLVTNGSLGASLLQIFLASVQLAFIYGRARCEPYQPKEFS